MTARKPDRWLRRRTSVAALLFVISCSHKPGTTAAGDREPAARATQQTEDANERRDQVNTTGSEPIAWGKPSNGLRLGLAVAAPEVVFYLENLGDKPLKVDSHVDAGEIHLDWYSLELVDSAGQARTIRFIDDRDKSAAVQKTLPAGARLDHRVDVAAWATRAINGEQPLAPDQYTVRGRYEVEPEDGIWSGRIEAVATTKLVQK